MISARLAAIIVLALATPTLAACGDDDNGGGDSGSGGGAYGGATPTKSEPAESSTGASGGASSGGGGTTLEIAADPDGALAFDKSSLTAKAGKVTISMDNPSTLPHAVEIEGNGVEDKGETVMKGGVSTAAADLEPGEYEFYCPVGGHRAGGMTGTLTVS